MFLPGRLLKKRGQTVDVRAARNRARVPFSEIPPATLRAALEALDLQRIPESYEQVVRDYFGRLRAMRGSPPGQPRGD